MINQFLLSQMAEASHKNFVTRRSAHINSRISHTEDMQVIRIKKLTKLKGKPEGKQGLRRPLYLHTDLSTQP